MITARPIRFTDHLDHHQRVLDAVGARLLVEAPGWFVYALGSGRLALHQANEHQPSGMTTLAFEVPDLEAWSAAARERGLEHRVGETDHGTAGIVTAPDGTGFTVDPVDHPVPTGDPAPGLVVLPIWYTPDTDSALDVLTGVGAQRRLSGEDGIWHDLTCPGGGLIAVHRHEHVDVELAFEYGGDVEELGATLRAAGLDSTLIDESYARTLRLPDPDRPGAEIWVNEAQRDLYGYRKLG